MMWQISFLEFERDFLLPILIFLMLGEAAIGILIMRKITKKLEWTDSYKPAVIINVIWLIINLILVFLIPFGQEIAYIINFLVGIPLIMKLYDQKFRISLGISAVMILILFLISIMLILILILVLALLSILGYIEPPPSEEDEFVVGEEP